MSSKTTKILWSARDRYSDYLSLHDSEPVWNDAEQWWMAWTAFAEDLCIKGCKTAGLPIPDEGEAIKFALTTEIIMRKTEETD